MKDGQNCPRHLFLRLNSHRDAPFEVHYLRHFYTNEENRRGKIPQSLDYKARAEPLRYNRCPSQLQTKLKKTSVDQYWSKVCGVIFEISR